MYDGLPMKTGASTRCAGQRLLPIFYTLSMLDGDTDIKAWLLPLLGVSSLIHLLLFNISTTIPRSSCQRYCNAVFARIARSTSIDSPTANPSCQILLRHARCCQTVRANLLGVYANRFTGVS